MSQGCPKRQDADIWPCLISWSKQRSIPEETFATAWSSAPPCYSVGLLVGSNAGVEYGPAWAVAVRRRHDYSSGRSSAGSTSKALASLRMVLKWGSTRSFSMRLSVAVPIPALPASSSWVSSARSRTLLTCVPILTTSPLSVRSCLTTNDNQTSSKRLTKINRRARMYRLDKEVAPQERQLPGARPIRRTYGHRRV